MDNKYILELKNVHVSDSSGKEFLKGISVSFKPNSITSIIGPPESGKTTLLRSINRMYELYPNIRTSGDILLNGSSIFNMNAIEVRKKIGMVFQKPSPFPNMNIYNNVIAGYLINRISLSTKEKDKLVEENLEAVGLWQDLKFNLNKKASSLSVGEQQRLCIARSIALNPDILLLDEPTFSLSLKSVNKIEELMFNLKEKHTIIIATSNLSQAARISKYSLFLDHGEAIEYDKTSELFMNPKDSRTEKYITGIIE